MPEFWRDWAVRMGWTFLAVALVVALHLVRGASLSSLPAGGNNGSGRSALTWAEPADAAVIDWTIVQPGGAPRTTLGGRIPERFRLAGTFFVFGETESRQRSAILEDMQAGAHLVVSEGDRIDDVEVVSIFRDRAVLRDAAGEEELWLRFAGGEASAKGSEGATGAERQPTAESIPVDRFGGRRIGVNRWVFSRKSLLNYYQELRDEPERLVKVFDSLEPLYDDVKSITGYRLNTRGEADFFRSVGLKDGDVVRRVNSVPMTNRRRAEFFISQFVQNHANAFAVEVERNGEDAKLVYEIRE